MSAKRVAVLGAGPCGLGSLKCCLDEGLEPVCFERTSHIGGLWHYSEDVTDGQGSVAKTTVVLSSKEILTFSDFLFPKDFANYMHNTKVLEYFHMYVKKFDLEKYIRLNVEVKNVAKAEDFAESGQWKLDIFNKTTGETRTEVFDAVLLCTGHHADKYIPRFEGDDIFKGKLIHTCDYRDHQGYEDKRVVIIGIGASAVDCAVDLSRISKQVYLSTRTGCWINGRIGEGGMPADLLANRRFKKLVEGMIPPSVLASMNEAKVNRRFDHTAYGLKPKHRFHEAQPVPCDDLPNRICCGSIVVKPDVKRFTESGVEFVDGSVAEDIDAIILGTGYVFGFPYLEDGIIDVQRNEVELFKYAFPPDLEQPTLAVIGCVQPLGSINAIAEIQSRFVTRVFKGVTKLPSKDEMWDDIKRLSDARRKMYRESQRHTIQVEMMPFMDEVAELIGCKPRIGPMLLRDPKLALAVFFGPFAPYQYRLEGPGKWDGAREAIMTIKERVMAPLQTMPAAVLAENTYSVDMFAALGLLLAIFSGLLLAIMFF